MPTTPGQMAEFRPASAGGPPCAADTPAFSVVRPIAKPSRLRSNTAVIAVSRPATIGPQWTRPLRRSNPYLPV